MLSVHFLGSFVPTRQIGRTADLHGDKQPHRGVAQGSAACKPRIVMYRTYSMLVLHDCMDAGGRATQEAKTEEQKPAIPRKAFTVKQVILKNVQSNA